MADALLMAYRTNPSLASQRDQLRALDEGVVQARAGWRPTLSASMSVSYNGVKYPPGESDSAIQKVETNEGAWGLNASQPLYTGGRTLAAVRAAEASVMAGREAVAAGEQSILQSVIQAYADVQRDQSIVEVREEEVRSVEAQLDGAQWRFKTGDVTQTDVLQSQTQVELSRANLLLAQGQLQISRASYAAVVGETPGQLDPEPPLPGLPKTVEQAFDAADADNPSLRQTVLQEQSSRQKIAQAKAASRPTIAAQLSVGYTEMGGNGQSSYGQNYPHGQWYEFAPATSYSAQIALSQPLFAGGVNASNVRETLANNASDQMSIEITRRTTIQAVSQDWNSLISARASAAMDERQITTAKAYLADTQIEYKAGQRSTLDVLIAEQTLTAAKIALATANHDSYVGQAALLSAMGRLRLRNLIGAAATYDPTVSYRHVTTIGGTPWDDLVRSLDSIGAPHVGGPSRVVMERQPQPKPEAAGMRAADQTIPADAPLSTAGHP